MKVICYRFIGSFGHNFIVMQEVSKEYDKEVHSYHNQTNSALSKEEEHFDAHLTKKKRIIFWLYLICLAAFSMAILGLISTSYDPVNQMTQSDNYYFANQIVSDWQLGYINDILVTSSSECPTGYQHAFTYNWRGTGFGCHCKNGANVSFVLEAYCSPSLIQSNCTNMGSEDPREAHLWKNKSNICVRRSEVSFATESKYDGTNKICGSSQSLTIVPNTEPCPIVNISMTAFNLEDNVLTAADADSVLPSIYATFNSTSPFSFYSYPVGKFSVSEYEFCQIDEDTGLSPSHVDFVLLTVPKGCFETGNYTNIDSTTETQFYANNRNLEELTEIEGFPEAGNWEYHMGFKSVPSWTYRCRHNLEGKFSVSEASKQLNFEVFGVLQAGSIVIIISCVVVVLEVVVLGMRRCVNSSIYPVGYRQKHLPGHFCWASTRYMVDCACKLLILVFGLIFAFNAYGDWHWFKEVQNQKCHHDSLEMVEFVILPFQRLHLLLLHNSTAIVFLTLAMLFVDSLHFHYVYNNELCYYLVDNNQRLVDLEEDNAQQPQETKDRLNDMKWLEMDNVEELAPNKNDDELRVTMAQNLFAGEEESSPQKLKKKKKKKPLNKRGLFNKEPEGRSAEGNYLFDDDVFGDPLFEQSQSAVEQPSIINLKSGSSKNKQRNIRRPK